RLSQNPLTLFGCRSTSVLTIHLPLCPSPTCPQRALLKISFPLGFSVCVCVFFWNPVLIEWLGPVRVSSCVCVCVCVCVCICVCLILCMGDSDAHRLI